MAVLLAGSRGAPLSRTPSFVPRNSECHALAHDDDAAAAFEGLVSGARLGGVAGLVQWPRERAPAFDRPAAAVGDVAVGGVDVA
jgi:hypothetical protein